MKASVPILTGALLLLAGCAAARPTAQCIPQEAVVWLECLGEAGALATQCEIVNGPPPPCGQAEKAIAFGHAQMFRSQDSTPRWFRFLVKVEADGTASRHLSEARPRNRAP